MDLTDELTAHQLANVIHQAAFRKLFDERAVRVAMDRANGRRNLNVLERALELNKTGSAGTRSDLEDRFLALTSRSGLPEPLGQRQSPGHREIDQRPEAAAASLESRPLQPTDAGAASASRSLNRWILPVGVRGKSGTKSTTCGYS